MTREPGRRRPPCSPCAGRPSALRLAGVAAACLLLAGSFTLYPADGARADPVRGVVIVVYKSQRRLFMFQNDVLKRRFPITLGKRPEGEKHRQGDFRTPEGEYFISSKRPRSRFRLFLGLSYPNARDAEEGLQRGAISGPEYEEIRGAIRTGREPSWDTALGGFVGIHGEGSEYRGFVRRHRIDWTDGCIALSNEDIRILYDLVEVGTPVLIFP